MLFLLCVVLPGTICTIFVVFFFYCTSANNCGSCLKWPTLISLLGHVTPSTQIHTNVLWVLCIFKPLLTTHIKVKFPLPPPKPNEKFALTTVNNLPFRQCKKSIAPVTSVNPHEHSSFTWSFFFLYKIFWGCDRSMTWVHFIVYLVAIAGTTCKLPEIEGEEQNDTSYRWVLKRNC